MEDTKENKQNENAVMRSHKTGGHQYIDEMFRKEQNEVSMKLQQREAISGTDVITRRMLSEGGGGGRGG